MYRLLVSVLSEVGCLDNSLVGAEHIVVEILTFLEGFHRQRSSVEGGHYFESIMSNSDSASFDFTIFKLGAREQEGRR